MATAIETDTWTASLELVFARVSEDRTALTRNVHTGPLLVQKALYPEGSDICHATILHPPSGIAGGDVLDLSIVVEESAHAVVTTPGATRWYKANGKHARQHIDLQVKAQGTLDWLPLENLLFEQSQAINQTHIHLATGARAIGWDCYQLGSAVTPGHWNEGRLNLSTRLHYDGKLVWTEAGEANARHSFFSSQAGLAGFPVMATVWSVGPTLDAAHLERLTDALPWTAQLRAGASQIPLDTSNSLVMIRLLGLHAQAVRLLMIECWQQLRPLQLGRPASPLRLWRT